MGVITMLFHECHVILDSNIVLEQDDNALSP